MRCYLTNIKFVLDENAGISDYVYLTAKFRANVAKSTNYSAIANTLDIKRVSERRILAIYQLVAIHPIIAEVYIDKKLAYANGVWQSKLEDAVTYELTKEEFDALKRK